MIFVLSINGAAILYFQSYEAQGWFSEGERIIGPAAPILRKGRVFFRDHTVDGSEIRLTTREVYNLVNNGIDYLSTGAGFLPSTVWCGLHDP